MSQYYLGMIYYEGKYVSQNVNKAIHYLTLSSNHNYSPSQNYLGMIYYVGKYVSRDINKAIHYFTLSANQNNSNGQCWLGFVYTGPFVEKNFNKGIYFFIQSSNNECKDAYFPVGFFYHEGKHIKQDIYKAIQYYKEASNFYSNFAKNNLGIIYKNGFSDEIKPNIQLSIEYFEESIHFKNDLISMYNLAHIYLYNYIKNDKLTEAIELLISSISTNKSFLPSFYLLSLALIKKHNFEIDKINRFLKKQTKDLHSKISQIIVNEQLLVKNFYDNAYDYYKNVEFLYDYEGSYFESQLLFKSKNIENQQLQTKININQDFFQGFGLKFLV